MGNIREVWNATNNTTTQRTQYYPSGLPWTSNIGDYPSAQSKKYNGKEFVEMHGYDTYDIVWRQYYPAIVRFQTQDPKIEDAYNESPYAMCDNNMINRTDPDGRVWNYIAGAALGGLFEYGSQVTANVVDGKGLSSFTENIDLFDIGVSMLEGGATSGGSVIKSAFKKAAVALVAETSRNIYDAKTTKNGTTDEFNSTDNVVKNTVIGLTIGSVTTKTKVNVVPTRSANQSVKIERKAAHSKGNGLSANKAKTIQAKTPAKNTNAKNVNKTISTNVNKTAGGTGAAIIKDKTDEKK